MPDSVCWVTLLVWYGMQFFAHCQMSFLIPCHMNFSVIRRPVASLMDGTGRG